jgi:hypothetical protein
VRRVGHGTDFSKETTKLADAPLDRCFLHSGSLVHFNPAWTRLLDVQRAGRSRNAVLAFEFYLLAAAMFAVTLYSTESRR